MKGLLLKEWCVLKKYFKLTLTVCAVMLICGAYTGNWLFIFTAVTVAGSSATSLISYDERSRFSEYLKFMPLRARTIVSAKYAVMLILTLGFTLCGVCLRMIFMHFGGGGDYAETVVYGTFVVCAGLVSPCLTMPFAFFKGVEKARMIYVLGIAVAFAAAGAVSVGEPQSIAAAFPLWTAAAAMIFSAVITAVSYAASVRLYRLNRN